MQLHKKLHNRGQYCSPQHQQIVGKFIVEPRAYARCIINRKAIKVFVLCETILYLLFSQPISLEQNLPYPPSLTDLVLHPSRHASPPCDKK
jgi:hypothetical protein